MKVSVEIDVPDGEYCGSTTEYCSKITWLRGFWRCREFGEQNLEDENSPPLKKLPECLSAPKAMDCGHHPDAVGIDHDYRDNSPFSYCVACKKEKQSEDFHGMLQMVKP